MVGRRRDLLCWCVVVCLKAGEEVIQLIQQRDRVVAGLQRGFDVLEPTPPVPGTSAVVEAVRQVGPDCPLVQLVPSSEGSVLSPYYS